MLTDAIEAAEAVREEAPLLAHYTPTPDGVVAFCGKRLMGFPAPPRCATCVVCQSIMEARAAAAREAFDA